MQGTGKIVHQPDYPVLERIVEEQMRTSRAEAIKKVKAWFDDAGIDYKGTSAPSCAARILSTCLPQTRKGLIGKIRATDDAEILKHAGVGKNSLRALREFAGEAPPPSKEPPARTSKPSDVDSALSHIRAELTVIGRLVRDLSYNTPDMVAIRGLMLELEELSKPKKSWWRK